MLTAINRILSDYNQLVSGASTRSDGVVGYSRCLSLAVSTSAGTAYTANAYQIRWRQEDLTAIPTPTTTPTTASNVASPPLSTGALAGIGVGAVVGLAAVLLAGWLVWRWRRRDPSREVPTPPPWQGPYPGVAELDPKFIAQLDAPPPEMPGHAVYWPASEAAAHELDATVLRQNRHRTDGTGFYSARERQSEDDLPSMPHRSAHENRALAGEVGRLGPSLKVPPMGGPVQGGWGYGYENLETPNSDSFAREVGIDPVPLATSSSPTPVQVPAPEAAVASRQTPEEAVATTSAARTGGERKGKAKDDNPGEEEADAGGDSAADRHEDVEELQQRQQRLQERRQRLMELEQIEREEEEIRLKLKGIGKK